MGQNFLDQYSLLHLATGIMAYFLGLSLPVWLALHILFEATENTPTGMRVINNYLTFWPGGKPRADSRLNSLGDTVAAVAGWLLAALTDSTGKRLKWY